MTAKPISSRKLAAIGHALDPSTGKRPFRELKEPVIEVRMSAHDQVRLNLPDPFNKPMAAPDFLGRIV